jgi:hypothetical protein
MHNHPLVVQATKLVLKRRLWQLPTLKNNQIEEFGNACINFKHKQLYGAEEFCCSQQTG